MSTRRKDLRVKKDTGSPKIHDNDDFDYNIAVFYRAYISWDKRGIYGYILGDNDPLTNKTAISIPSSNGLSNMIYVATSSIKRGIKNGDIKIDIERGLSLRR